MSLAARKLRHVALQAVDRPDPRRRRGDRVARGVLAAVRAEEPQRRHPRPEHAPEQPRAEWADEPTRAVARPDDEPEERIEENRAGGSSQRARRACKELAEPLAEPPDDEHPAERREERELDRRPEEDADPERDLGEREQRVPDGEVGPGEARPPGEHRPKPRRLSRLHAREEPREAVCVHERLELQPSVEEPQHPQRRPDGAGAVRTEAVGEGRRRPGGRPPPRATTHLATRPARRRRLRSRRTC